MLGKFTDFQRAIPTTSGIIEERIQVRMLRFSGSLRGSGAPSLVASAMASSIVVR
jgi:hypothetical protein